MPFLKQLLKDPAWLDDYPCAREAWNVFTERILLDSDMLEDVGMTLEAEVHGDLFVGFVLKLGGSTGAYMRITAYTYEKLSFDSCKMPNSEISFSTPVNDSVQTNLIFTLVWVG